MGAHISSYEKVRSIGYFHLLLLSTFLASCSDPPHWIARDELQPAHEPNIQKLAFVNDSELVFNYELGWYDLVNSSIEGTDVVGRIDTVPLAHVQRLEIAAKPDNVETALLILGIVTFTLVAGANMFGALLGP